MITMDRRDLGDQAGMERAFRQYFKDVQTECAGTLNAMLDARFLSCDWDMRTMILRAEARSWMVNPNGILHGGVTAAYLDLAMGLLCRYCSGGRMTPTIQMDVSYLRSISPTDALCIQAEITKPGFTIFSAVGRIWAEGRPDRLLATATGSYFVSPSTEGIYTEPAVRED